MAMRLRALLRHGPHKMAREDRHHLRDLMREVGRLSAPGSAVFHDACSARYVTAGVVVGGARFVGGSDEYGELWARHAGFGSSVRVLDFRAVSVDRANRRVVVDRSVPEATPAACAGQNLVLFVEAVK